MAWPGERGFSASQPLCRVRATLHERFAAWLDDRAADLVELDEIVGYHLEQAARYRQELGVRDHELAERAGERLGVAGRRALWRGDRRAASGPLERALGLLRPLRLDVDLELDLAELQPRVRQAGVMAEAVAKRAKAEHDREVRWWQRSQQPTITLT
jgi:hypothetical protein